MLRPLWPSKILCRLFGHLDPDKDEITMVMAGVTVIKWCSACWGMTYKYEGRLIDSPDFDPSCFEETCDCGS